VVKNQKKGINLCVRDQKFLGDQQTNRGEIKIHDNKKSNIEQNNNSKGTYISYIIEVYDERKDKLDKIKELLKELKLSFEITKLINY